MSFPEPKLSPPRTRRSAEAGKKSRFNLCLFLSPLPQCPLWLFIRYHGHFHALLQFALTVCWDAPRTENTLESQRNRGSGRLRNRGGARPGHAIEGTFCVSQISFFTRITSRPSRNAGYTLSGGTFLKKGFRGPLPKTFDALALRASPGRQDRAAPSRSLVGRRPIGHLLMRGS